MKFPALLCCLACLLPALPSCRSSGKKEKKDSPDALSNLGDPGPMVQVGGFYKLSGLTSGFFDHVPNFTDVLPDHYMGHGTVVQLLDATVGEGWARVKSDKFGIGYTKFSNLKIVPYDEQPKPKFRDAEEELDRRMGIR